MPRFRNEAHRIIVKQLKEKGLSHNQIDKEMQKITGKPFPKWKVSRYLKLDILNRG